MSSITKNKEITQDKVGKKENDKGLQKRHYNEINFLLKNVSITKNTRILDLGCREGLLLDRLSRKIKSSNLYGIDISKEAIDYLNNRYKKIEGYIGDIHNLPFYSNSFDIVICSHTLEHSPDPEQVLGNIYRILTEKGICLIEVPIENVNKPRKSVGHFTAFNTEDKLLDMMKEYFEIVDSGKNPHKTKNWFMVIGEKNDGKD